MAKRITKRFVCGDADFAVESNDEEEVIRMARMHMRDYHKSLKRTVREIMTDLQEL